MGLVSLKSVNRIVVEPPSARVSVLRHVISLYLVLFQIIVLQSEAFVLLFLPVLVDCLDLIVEFVPPLRGSFRYG